MEAISQDASIIPSPTITKYENDVGIGPNANLAVPIDQQPEAIVAVPGNPHTEVVTAEPFNQEQEIMAANRTPKDKETDPLIENYHIEFRLSRIQYNKTCKEKIIISMLQFVLATAGYSKRNIRCSLYVLLLLLLALFQLVYDCYVVFHCPNTNCKFQVDHNKNETKNPTRTIQNVSYTCASAGGLLSFIFMALTLYHTSGKKCKNALTLEAVDKDIFKKRLCLLAALLIFLIFCFVGMTSLFYYIVKDEVKLSRDFILLATGVGCQFVTQWTGLIACFVFGCISLAIGMFTALLSVTF